MQTRDVDNVMFGACVYRQLPGIDGLQHECAPASRQCAKLMPLYVSERALKRGIAAKLVDAVLQYAFDGQTVRQVELGVAEHNHKHPIVRADAFA